MKTSNEIETECFQSVVENTQRQGYKQYKKGLWSPRAMIFDREYEENKQSGPLVKCNDYLNIYFSGSVSFNVAFGVFRKEITVAIWFEW